MEKGERERKKSGRGSKKSGKKLTSARKELWVGMFQGPKELGTTKHHKRD